MIAPVVVSGVTDPSSGPVTTATVAGTSIPPGLGSVSLARTSSTIGVLPGVNSLRLLATGGP